MKHNIVKPETKHAVYKMNTHPQMQLKNQTQLLSVTEKDMAQQVVLPGGGGGEQDENNRYGNKEPKAWINSKGTTPLSQAACKASGGLTERDGQL